MEVKTEHRGHRLGQALIPYFIDAVGQTSDIFVGTGLIHKPVVALSLARAGLSPESDDFLVEILPKSTSDETDVPKVNVVKNNVQADVQAVDSSPCRKFYEVVPLEVVRRNYSINSPGMVVALHTVYLPQVI